MSSAPRSSSPSASSSRFRASTTAGTPRPRSQRSSSQACPRRRRARDRRVRRRGAAPRAEGRGGRRHRPRQLRAPSAELAADLAAVRNGGRVLALFQPHLYSRTVHLAHEFAVALAARTRCASPRSIPRAKSPARRDRTADRRRARGGAARDAARLGACARGRSRSRRVVGAARRHRAHPRRRRRRSAPRRCCWSCWREARGGRRACAPDDDRYRRPARAFARPESLAEVEELLRWAADAELGVATVGLGSNLLAADDGVDALVLKLDGELADVAFEGDVVHAGGGAANAGRAPSRAERRARGLRVRLRDPGHDRRRRLDERRRLRRRLRAGARARARRDRRRLRLADAGGARALVPALEPASTARSSSRPSSACAARPGTRSRTRCAS